MGKEANADQSRPVICDQNASNLESDELQSSTQTAITANATKVTNTGHYYSSPNGYAQKQEPADDDAQRAVVADMGFKNGVTP